MVKDSLYQLNFLQESNFMHIKEILFTFAYVIIVVTFQKDVLFAAVGQLFQIIF